MPIDRGRVEHPVERHQGAIFQQRLGRQQPVPGISVRPVELRGVLRVVAGDGQFVDGVAPECCPQLLRRQVDAPRPAFSSIS